MCRSVAKTEGALLDAVHGISEIGKNFEVMVKEFRASEKDAMSQFRSMLKELMGPPSTGSSAGDPVQHFQTFAHVCPDLRGFSEQERELFAQLDRIQGRMKRERFYERNKSVPRRVLEKVFDYFEEMLEVDTVARERAMDD